MKVVLDVNILASASVFPSRTQGLVLDLGLTGSFDLMVSDPILDRLAVVLTRPYFDARLTDAIRLRFLESLELSGEKITPDPTVRGVAPDLEDDLVLGTAVAANAGFLVTGARACSRSWSFGECESSLPASFCGNWSRSDLRHLSRSL